MAERRFTRAELLMAVGGLPLVSSAKASAAEPATYTKAEVDALLAGVDGRLDALEGAAPQPPPPPPPAAMKVDIYAWWPNALKLADWASIGVNHFMIPKKIGRSDTPSLEQLRPYTCIAPYDPTYSPGAAFIVANFIEPDEPDAAAGARRLPVDPAKFIADAKAVKTADPSRPTYASLGRSWVDLNYNGRGSAQHGQEAPLAQYASAVDEMTFFVYPMTVPNTTTNAAIYRKIDCPLIGVERMSRLAPGKRIGLCMEAGNIYNVRRPTYDEMIHEATGAVDKARSLGHTSFKLMFFNQRTVGGFDGNDGLNDPGCRRAMTDLAQMYRT